VIASFAQTGKAGFTEADGFCAIRANDWGEMAVDRKISSR